MRLRLTGWIVVITLFIISPLLAQGQDCNCKYTVDASMTYMDAALSWPDLGPGDTLCVQAGVRNRLFIKNIQGAPGKPVTIINCGGQVIFDNTTSSEGAFSVVASQYFRISGTGSPQHRYGFFLRTNKKGSSMHLSYSDYELDHVEIGDAGFAGVMSKIDPHCNNPEYWRGNFVMQNISIHDNYIHHTHGEGLYIGNTSFAGKQTSECGTLLPHELHHVRIYNNRIEDTGADGLQLSCATQDVEVYNNHIERFGTDPFAPHQNQGLIIGGGSSGKYYNNRIINGTGSGISCFGLGRIELFNNLIYRPDGYGIFVDERSDMPKGSGYLVAHNTIVEPGLDGFRIYSLNAENSRLANNIIAQPNRLPKKHIKYSYTSIRKGVDITLKNNAFVASTADVKFKNLKTFDLSLTKASPARKIGKLLSEVRADIAGTQRGNGGSVDAGAYEFLDTKTNIAPKVYAGKDIKAVLSAGSLELSGTASDADGNIVSTTWEQISGHELNIVDPSSLWTLVNNLQAGNFTFKLTVKDNSGATAEDLVKVKVTDDTENDGNDDDDSNGRDINTTDRLLVNFNYGDNAPAPWNNFNQNPDAGDKLANLKSENGAKSSVKITLMTPWGFKPVGSHGYNSQGTVTGNNSGIVEDQVLKTCIWSALDSPELIEISGLDANATYNFKMTGSRKGSGDRTTLYTINDVTVSLNATNNTQNLVSFDFIQPSAEGKVNLYVQKGKYSQYAYINALIIEKNGSANNSSVAATDIEVSKVTHTKAAISWRDNEKGEDGYEVAISSNGKDYTVVGKANANQTQYSLNNLKPETAYYLTITTIKGSERVQSSPVQFKTFKALEGILVNFNYGYNVESPWNNVDAQPVAGVQLTNLTDSKNNPSNISLKLDTRWGWKNSQSGGYNANGTFSGSNSGVYPDYVMKTCFWTQRTEGAELLVEGLEPSRSYTFKLFGGRRGTGNKATMYTINGEKSTINAAQNTTEVATFYNVHSDEKGTLKVYVNQANGSEYAYLNAMEIIPSGASAYSNAATEAYTERKLTETNYSNFSLYPNPAVDHIVVEYDNQTIGDQLVLQVIDLSGQVRETVNYEVNGSSSELKIDLFELNLASGIYILKVGNQTNMTSETIRFMIR